MRSERLFHSAVNDRKLLAVLLVCFLVRFLILLVFMQGFWAGSGLPVGADGWSPFAESLVGVGDYQPQAMRPPIFPVFLAVLYNLFGVNYFAVRVVLIVLDVLICLAIYILAQKMFGNRTVSRWASLIWALYYPEYPYLTHIFPQSFYTLLLLFFVFSMMKAKSRPILSSFAVMGIFYGLLNLTRSELSAFFIVMVFIFCIRFHPLRLCRIRPFCIFVLISAIVVFPWGMRNYLRYGYFKTGSSITGLHLYSVVHKFDKQDFVSIRSFDYVGGYWDMYNKCRAAGIKPGFDAQNEFERNDRYVKESLHIIFEHPIKYAVFWLNNLLAFSLGMSDFSFASWRSLGIFMANAFLLVFTLVGFIRFKGPWRSEVKPIIALVLYYAIAYAFIIGGCRYAIPIIPYMAIFSAYGLARTIQPSRSAEDGERRSFALKNG